MGNDTSNHITPKTRNEDSDRPALCISSKDSKRKESKADTAAPDCEKLRIENGGSSREQSNINMNGPRRDMPNRKNTGSIHPMLCAGSSGPDLRGSIAETAGPGCVKL